MSNTESCAILRNCFIRPDEWGGYPWQYSAIAAGYRKKYLPVELL